MLDENYGIIFDNTQLFSGRHGVPKPESTATDQSCRMILAPGGGAL